MASESKEADSDVTLPLSPPILATVGIIAFANSWNNFLLPIVQRPAW